jgi:hypothetical protein
MDNGNEMRDFLVSRRARITPEQAGLPAYGGNRRVAGLRREEVALLAGVSIDYYTRLERGRPTASWKESPAPCTWMRPSALTCSTSPAPPPARPCRGRPAVPHRSRCGPASSASWTR